MKQRTLLEQKAHRFLIKFDYAKEQALRKYDIDPNLMNYIGGPK